MLKASNLQASSYHHFMFLIEYIHICSSISC